MSRTTRLLIVVCTLYGCANESRLPKNANVINMTVFDSSTVIERATVDVESAELRGEVVDAVIGLKFLDEGVPLSVAADMARPEIDIAIRNMNDDEYQLSIYWGHADRGPLVLGRKVYEVSGLNRLRDVVTLCTGLNEHGPVDVAPTE